MAKELSVAILKNIESEKETTYSALLSNEKLVREAGSVDTLTLELYRLLAQGFAKVAASRDETDADKVVLSITEIGKSYVGMKDKALTAGTE